MERYAIKAHTPGKVITVAEDMTFDEFHALMNDLERHRPGDTVLLGSCKESETDPSCKKCATRFEGVNW